MIKSVPKLKKTSRQTVRKSKPAVAKRSGIRQTLMLSLFSDANFAGIRRDLVGNIAVRNMATIDLDDDVESLRLSGGSQATLVIFRRNNYQGTFRIFTGPRQISDLRDINFENDISSLILSSRPLTEAEIAEIQRTRRPPLNYAEILRRKRKSK